MKKTIVLDNRNFSYELTHKNVKNVNLRIKKDGTINVSANPFVPQRIIDDFIMSKEQFILKALKKFEHIPETQCVQYFTAGEINDVILGICKKVYPYFENKGIKYPQIKFRRMTSCWGNCRSVKGILTFNTNLMYAPLDCIEYVVLHEFTHFLQSNHSRAFYEELEMVCPDWKEKRRKLKGINI